MISTQYARNGPLVTESRDFVRLVAAGNSRIQRRQRMVVENSIGRRTAKSRRNLFEALEARYSDERHAHDLGVLSFASAPPRALTICLLSELSANDELVESYLKYVCARIGEELRFADARLFIAELAISSTPVAGWAPSLQRRAVTALNALPWHFGLWDSRRPPIVPRPRLPLESMAMLFLWQIERDESVFNARFLQTIAMRKSEVLEALWACARRGWFEVEAAGDVVRARPESNNVGTLFGIAQPALVGSVG